MYFEILFFRNLFLNPSNEEVKISDFGLFGTLKNSETPEAIIKWTAPEVLNQSSPVTSKSDVWSYGVTLWELFNYGRYPYESLSNKETPLNVLQGNRLPRP